MQRNNKGNKKAPWPTKKAMEQVYNMKLWGDNNSQFYSGTGSHDPDIISDYIKTITEFLNSFKEPINVCDLGCGDFNIGKNFVAHSNSYMAIDIVPDLIRFNKAHFKADNLKFDCLDIAKDELPVGDCVIIRQVLQHLSNPEIEAVVNKLQNYKYLLLTEHLPNGEFVPNIDIISGQGIRLKKKSGVDLLKAPFNLKVKSKKELLSIKLENNKGIILTTYYEL